MLPAKVASLIEKEGIPVGISTDANLFICNSLGYLTAKKISDEGLRIKHYFIHIPWTDNFKGMIKLDQDKVFIPYQDLEKALDIIISSV